VKITYTTRRDATTRGSRHRVSRVPQIVKMQAGQASLIKCLDPDVPEVGPAKPTAPRADENQAVWLRVHKPL
jgi:hypothetical protein